MERAELLAEVRLLRKDIDHYMNTGEMADGWAESPHGEAFREAIDALVKHIPVPHDINELLEKEATRRIEARSG